MIRKRFIGIAFIFLLSLQQLSFDLPVAHAVTTVKAATVTAPKKNYTAQELYGQFIIEKESYDRLWYVSPVTKQRYYIKDAAELQWLIDNLGKKITQKELSAITSYPRGLTAGLLTGRIVYVNKTSPMYLHPTERKLYKLNDFDLLAASAKKFGFTVTDTVLRKVAMNSLQMTFDPAFSGTAYATFNGDEFGSTQSGNTILPLASLTKLMTALTILDLQPDWNKTVTITADEINYPKTLVGGDATSEVAIKTGDKVQYGDLWFAMLLASSNQSAVILADNSGKTRKEFIALMNAKAAEFGLKRTRFADMSGLDVNNVSTAKEMAVIAQRAFAKYKIMEPSHVASYSFSVTSADGTQRTVNVVDRNNSLHQFGVDAAKTGFLIEAQRNVVIKKGTTIYAVLHSYSLNQRNQILQQLIAQ